MVNKTNKHRNPPRFPQNTALPVAAPSWPRHFDFARDLIARVEAGELTQAEAYELLKAENTLYSVCLNCNTGCGIKVKILDGVAVKIDGNPYNPFNLASPPGDEGCPC